MKRIFMVIAAAAITIMATAQNERPTNWFIGAAGGLNIGFDGKEYIFYNDRKNYRRCNMTILHEIGHAVLGHTEETNHDIAEAEAAFFAKYAIAPPPLVHKIQSKTAVAISEQFDISLEAAMYARDYYLKWLQFGPHDYLEYEVVLLNQVQLSVS